MASKFDSLITEILDNYHEKIHESVHYDELGEFLTALLYKYKEIHPYKRPSITDIDGVKIIDPGDFHI
ncbi:hypothetical protein [Streptococcus suis]|uniref:Uncharacterized protein n=1 Tax=Streptococcus suis TaxID=1307 RepID=A0A0Z8FVT6_STRSU|nr:hypothetical protein [Streptococcus suis]NQH14981.1 hypothetical protein [Streptococcus suis]NQH22510.1 hypothetical protein [Streptococcus suis]NQH48581.1 hypothetical protein [Streptococcus suis]NQN39328.1 hypothetical protein [Streptococcus suis]NQO74749.1 hypothetical protein [Streptococcus suis]